MNKLIYWLLNISLLIIFSIYFSASFAKNSANKQTINLLTWWGYLNYPEIINAAESECKVNISFDEYFSNDEFLRRWEAHKDNYDVIIFSNTIYNIVKNKIPHLNKSTLWQQSNSYHPTIKVHYDKMKYPHNIIYFIHAMTGFLWNPSNITLSSNDSVTEIFNKAKKNYVVIIDDPVEANKLIKASLGENQENTINHNILTISNFDRVIQDSNVYITNNYSQIYKKSKFAFSFSWSGEAVVDLIESNKGYKFLIHPRLSYISSDLIAQTSNKNSSLCVAKFLTAKKTMSIIQNKDFYFSSYTDYSNIQNPIFKNIYKNFVTSLPILTWIDSINENDFQNMNQSWQLIKLSLNNHLRGE